SVQRDAAGNPVSFQLNTLPNGAVNTFPTTVPSELEIGGITITLDSGVPGAGSAADSWLIQPTRSAGSTLKLEIVDPEKIAAAAPGTGTANGDNALAMARLQTGKTLGNGSLSLNEAYSQIVNKVGVLTQQNSTEAKATATLIQQNYAAQQAVSGVNLNEEYVMLERFQEQFRAASKLVEVSSTLFDTLLSLRT